MDCGTPRLRMLTAFLRDAWTVPQMRGIHILPIWEGGCCWTWPSRSIKGKDLYARRGEVVCQIPLKPGRIPVTIFEGNIDARPAPSEHSKATEFGKGANGSAQQQGIEQFN